MKWLAGERYSLADATMLPDVLRLEHLGLDWFWSDLAAVANWLDAARNRPTFRAVHEHLDPQYLALMRGSSDEYRGRIESLILETRQ